MLRLRCAIDPYSLKLAPLCALRCNRLNTISISPTSRRLSYALSSCPGSHGFPGHPLQVITQATANNARILGKETELGYVRAGYVADLIVVDGNPLADLRILYPKTQGVPQSGKIEWTIKDGIPFHAPSLAADVRKIVEEDRKNPQPRINTP